jgi:hypothetical protein
MLFRRRTAAIAVGWVRGTKTDTRLSIKLVEHPTIDASRRLLSFPSKQVRKRRSHTAVKETWCFHKTTDAQLIWLCVAFRFVAELWREAAIMGGGEIPRPELIYRVAPEVVGHITDHIVVVLDDTVIQTAHCIG